MTSRFVYVTIKIMHETCFKRCLLLEILRTVKCMSILHYYCDIACPGVLFVQTVLLLKNTFKFNSINGIALSFNTAILNAENV